MHDFYFYYNIICNIKIIDRFWIHAECFTDILTKRMCTKPPFLHVFKVCPLTHGIPSCIRWASPLNMVSVLPVWSSCACVDMTGYRCTHWSLILFLLQVLFRFWQYLYSGIVLSDLECCAVVVNTFQLNSCLIIFLHTFCIIWCFIFGSNQNVSLVN